MKKQLLTKSGFVVLLAVLVVIGTSCGKDDPIASTISDDPGVDAPRSRGEVGLSLAGQSRVRLFPDALSASSRNKPTEGTENLVGNGPGGYWHIRVPRREATAWLQIDLGRNPEPLSTLRIRPRADALNQLWRGDRAGLQASQDGESWLLLTRLSINRAKVTDDWLAFPIMNARPYRFYRLVFWDQEFKSIGRVELFRFPGAADASDGSDVDGPLTEGSNTLDVSSLQRIEVGAEQISSNSVNSQNERATALIAPGTAGYWHAKVGRSAGEAVWVKVDLGTDPVAARVLRVRPRVGVRDQMWSDSNSALQASQDGESWISLAQLAVKPEIINDQWITFTLNNSTAFRFYRLLIQDRRFLSLGRLELYSGPGPVFDLSSVPVIAGIKDATISGRQVALAAHQVSVSSANSPNEGGDTLVRTGTDGYWHLKTSEKGAAWIRLDIETPKAIRVVRLHPRADLPTQVWNGPAAVWQGSADGEQWTPIVRLSLRRAESQDTWWQFNLSPTADSYRYYRLLISDSEFFSIARVLLYE